MPARAAAHRDPVPVLESVRPPQDAVAQMAAEVRESLSARPLRCLPSKYFYDARGSALFEEITRLPEYYLTRTEETILPRVAAEVARAVSARELVELGSGSGQKVRQLIDALLDAGALERVTLLDVSASALGGALADLAPDYPGLELRGLIGDFQEDLPSLTGPRPRLIAFLGSTIGNLQPPEAARFLADVRTALQQGDALLLGLDLVKDTARLEAAYNDSQGVTAEFNRNILRVVNDRLGADFVPEDFDHRAFFSPEDSWIEMRLVARRAMRVRLPAAGLELRLRKGEEIRTEVSGKYTRPGVEALLGAAGLRLSRFWTDPESLFALALIEGRRGRKAG